MTFLGKAARDGLAFLEEGRRLSAADEAARLEQHDDDHGEAEEDHAVQFRREVGAEDMLEELHFAQRFRAADHDDRRNRNTRQRTHAAENDDGEDDRGLEEDEAFRRDEALASREERASKTTEHRTDRKGGHCLLDTQQRVWGIDHGVCFAADFKLRTVIWEFGGEELPQYLREVIEPLVESVPLNVSALLNSDEVFALQERAQWICEGGAFPIDKTGSRYPWPLV